jgi:hypothetical protein
MSALPVNGELKTVYVNKINNYKLDQPLLLQNAFHAPSLYATTISPTELSKRTTVVTLMDVNGH